MVVEDDREVADHLVDHLGEAGLTTFAFVTGEEAVLHAERMSQRGAALDLVLVDIGLPGIDGLEVVRRLRKERPTLAAFLITGYSDPNLTARAADLGVLKPFDDIKAFIGRVQAEGRGGDDPHPRSRVPAADQDPPRAGARAVPAAAGGDRARAGSARDAITVDLRGCWRSLAFLY